jgi:hypothetical protein
MLVLEIAEWSTSPSGRFIPRKDPTVHIEQEDAWVPETALKLWGRVESLAFADNRTVDPWLFLSCNVVTISTELSRLLVC